MTRHKQFIRECKRRLFWLLSHTKRQWRFKDYPLDYVDQRNDEPNIAENLWWRADLVGWLAFHGVGKTRREALLSLQQNFIEFQNSGRPQPRPGTGPPLEFASTVEISKLEYLLDEFIQDVLELPWAFISDESSLLDFHSKQDSEYYFVRIEAKYGIGVRDVPGEKILGILQKIKLAEITGQPQ